MTGSYNETSCFHTGLYGEMLPKSPHEPPETTASCNAVGIPADPTDDEGDVTVLDAFTVLDFLAEPLCREARVDIAVADGLRDMTPGAAGRVVLVAAPLTSFSDSAIGSRETNSFPSYWTTT